MAALFLRKTPWINSRLQQFFIPSSPWRNSKNQSLKPFWVTTLCTYILLSFHAKNIRSKVEAEVWRGLFEGGFLKGAFWRAIHDANLAVALILEEWTQHPQYGFSQWKKKYFLKLLSVLTWVLTNFNAETEGYIPNCLRPHHFFKGFITSKLTRIFVNFRVIHVLLSLILFYRIMLDQISHTWFEWNLVNGCTSWNSHPNCLYVCS